MSLSIYIAHLGRRLTVDVNEISSTDSLRSWIAENAGIQVHGQILMTSRGKNVKQQHLVAQGEIFVYDKRYLSTTFDAALEEPSAETLPSLREAPASLDDENSVKAWLELFRSRRTWALEATDLVRSAVESIERESDACEIIARSTGVAVENLQNHITNLQQSFDKTDVWAQESLGEHADTLKEWQGSVKTLSELPIREEIGRLLSSRQGSQSTGYGENSGTMQALLDNNVLDNAASVLASASDHFRDNLDQLRGSMKQLGADTGRISELSNVPWPNLDTSGMIQEAETIAKKISGDYEEVLRTSNETKSLPRISRQAAVHTGNLIPGLTELASECVQMLKAATSHRGNLSQNCLSALRQISAIQSGLAGLQSQISALGLDDDGQTSFDQLEKVFRLPVAYGSVLVEAIRRSEWNERTRTDLQNLKDDVSQQQDEELRRRKKWVASMTGFISDDIQITEALVDLQFSAPANPWPFVARDEVFSYIDDLRALGINDAVEQITQSLRELESLARPRKPKPKAFKNGSVHDLSQSSMLRNGDEVRGLQDEKLRLEDKLRASESRIRKLEDLLHRQSQLNRPASGSFTPSTDFERQPSSPTVGSMRPAEVASRRSSVSVRRLSNQASDEKAMAQRIVSLEAQITKLQQDAHAERRSSAESRDKMQEAESVKRDLMANFDAQRQEFEDERQRLEDDNHELKVRLEEVEEELDRVSGSRDHERTTQDHLVQSVRNELEKFRKTSKEEMDQLLRAREDLQRELGAQKERAGNAERLLHQHREDKSNLQSQNMTLAAQLRTVEEQQQNFLTSLQNTHANLSPSGSAPDTLHRLVPVLEVLSEGASIHSRGLDDALQLATAENKSNEEKIANLEKQVHKSGQMLEQNKKSVFEKDEALRQERSKLGALRSELASEQAELQNLRAKFAAGETGSDALKARLAEEEKRVTELLEAKGNYDAKIQGLTQELSDLSQQASERTAKEEDLKNQLDSRKQKAKELSERLFQHNDRIIRMLENFGFSVSRKDDGLLIQRASKANASTILANDASIAMKRTPSGSVSIQHYSDPSDLETLYWISDEDATLEDERYKTFMSALARLDMDATVELITKRYKDIETLAKKYQKDSRSFREKSHRLQSEANDKIAYRAFKEGDLALFLPTRNQATRPWAAFNVGAPHYFLREQDVHKLQSRDWLLARISKVEERIVDLSKSFAGPSTRDRASLQAEASDGASTKSVDDENPFELSDGLRWYLIDASEEKPGAPSTPGLGKSTVAASVVEVKGHMGRKSIGGKESGPANSAVNAAKTLHKSLDSRRSSEASRKSGIGGTLRPSGSSSSVNPVGPAPMSPITGQGHDGEAGGQISTPTVRPSDADLRANSQGPAREDAQVFEQAGEAAASRPTPIRTSSAEASRRLSPAKIRAASPAKVSTEQGKLQSPSKPRAKGWERLFNMEFNA